MIEMLTTSWDYMLRIETTKVEFRFNIMSEVICKQFNDNSLVAVWKVKNKRA